MAREAQGDLRYRKDIDGLRAIAVLLVVLFHVYPRMLTGGFIGVDVFFVISGFLITGLICSGLRDGTFSLSNFYVRRVRRIFPALSLVLAACIVVGWVLLFPADYRDLGKHVAASAAFVVNFTLLGDAGYFDTPSELKPVLHLWSLGIEEQFYILWPVLVLATWRRRRATIFIASAILAASFTWNVVLGGSDPAAAFFLPATRFWELMVGCLLALTLPNGGLHTLTFGRWRGSAAALCNTASLLGGLMIVVGAIVVGGRSFTGWWALLPTMGAALLLAAGPAAFVNGRVLSRSPLVHVGRMSYSLYLWHWPILAFIRHYHLKDPTDLMRFGGAVLAIALAALTYRFVETPIRRGASIAWKPAGALFAMALVGCAGLGAFMERGFGGRFPQEIAVLLKDEDNVAKEFFGWGLCVRTVDQDAFSLTEDCNKLPYANDSKRIVVWGDSHGANVLRGLVEVERGRRKIQVEFFTTWSCPPLEVDAMTSRCASANRMILDKIGSIRPDTVILAGKWAIYADAPDVPRVDEASIRDVVDRLKSLGIAHVVGVGQFPLWDYEVPRILARQYRERRGSRVAGAAATPIRSRDHLDPDTFIWDEKVRQWFLSAGAAFVSPVSTLCEDGGCLMTVPGHLDPMERDQDHLTNAGSIWFVKNNERGLVGE